MTAASCTIAKGLFQFVSDECGRRHSTFRKLLPDCLRAVFAMRQGKPFFILWVRNRWVYETLASKWFRQALEETTKEYVTHVLDLQDSPSVVVAFENQQPEFDL